ncbi:hypothetical protein ACX3T8_07625 [Corynebacterium pyruviciproducens]|nr:hypothetical protein [Corynebacterium pyruviciproducens]MDK6564829.1 hypothetical protein [Corynebacterium pyruviciproducens]
MVELLLDRRRKGIKEATEGGDENEWSNEDTSDEMDAAKGRKPRKLLVF